MLDLLRLGVQTCIRWLLLIYMDLQICLNVTSVREIFLRIVSEARPIVFYYLP